MADPRAEIRFECTDGGTLVAKWSMAAVCELEDLVTEKHKVRNLQAFVQKVQTEGVTTKDMLECIRCGFRHMGDSRPSVPDLVDRLDVDGYVKLQGFFMKSLMHALVGTNAQRLEGKSEEEATAIMTELATGASSTTN